MQLINTFNTHHLLADYLQFKHLNELHRMHLNNLQS